MASKQNMKEYPIRTIREMLRQESIQQAALLTRSVSRLTSCDAMPCLEYHQEVESECRIMDRLVYLQSCRDALEKCISSGAARLRYRWRDGRETNTYFRRVSVGRVRAGGLEEPASLPAAG